MWLNSPAVKNIFALVVLLTVCQLIKAGDPAEVDRATHLKILSYNVKFLPRYIIRAQHHPIKRARIIPGYLLDENPDVIVLEEAFDPKADRMLRKRMKKAYPYILGPVNKKPGFKINGGVMVLSKYPLKQLGQVQYSQCEDYDCWARKGVLLVEVSDGKHVFQIAGTHCNGGGSLKLKTSQYHEMGALVKEHAKQGIPQFLVGDYNTSNFDKPYYNSMIEQLDAEDGPITGLLQCTNDHLNNDMEPYFNTTERDLIDYILYRPNGLRPQAITRYVHSYCSNWMKGHDDLSDHYALLMDVVW